MNKFFYLKKKCSFSKESSGICNNQDLIYTEKVGNKKENIEDLNIFLPSIDIEKSRVKAANLISY